MATKGRPTVYSQEIARRICVQLSEGHSLKSICAAADMPARSTVYEWLDADGHDFSDRYARARARQAETMADEILEIADDASRDVVTVGEGKSKWERERFTASARDKLKIDSRKWLMARLAPKKYGDKLDLTSDGEKLPSHFDVRLVPAGPLLANSEREIEDV